jgi:hypothetical protein
MSRPMNAPRFAIAIFFSIGTFVPFAAGQAPGAKQLPDRAIAPAAARPPRDEPTPLAPSLASPLFDSQHGRDELRIRDEPLGRASLRLELHQRGWSAPAKAGELDSSFEPAFAERKLIAAVRRAGGSDTKLEIVEEARYDCEVKATQRSRHLAASGKRADVERVAQVATDILEANRGMIDVRVEFFRSAAAPASDAAKPRVEVLDEVELAAALVEARRTATRIAAPRVVAFLGQAAITTVKQDVEYVQDFDRVMVHGRAVVVPYLGRLETGSSFAITALRNPVTDALDLAVDVRLRGLAALREFTTRLANFTEDVTFDLPQISDARFASEDLRLTGDDVGLRIDGLRYSEQDENGKPVEHDVTVLIEVRPVAKEAKSATAARRGAVIGFDATTRQAFVALDPSASLPVRGDALVVSRDGGDVAAGVVHGVEGRLVVLALDHGEPRAGDEVR